MAQRGGAGESRLRPLRWPEDRQAILALDTSFVTDRIFDVLHSGTTFALQERSLSSPLRKTYPLDEEVDRLPDFDAVLIAERENMVVGFAALKVEDWNRRAVLWHLYVVPEARGRGIGKALLAAMEEEARTRRARCLWLETQNINADAIRFYRKCGFAWCGLDTSLYDPTVVDTQEVALFFVLPLE